MNKVLNFFAGKHLRGPLARKLLVRILFVSSLITLVLTALQLFKDYSDDYTGIEKKLNEIERSNIESLSIFEAQKMIIIGGISAS